MLSHVDGVDGGDGLTETTHPEDVVGHHVPFEGTGLCGLVDKCLALIGRQEIEVSGAPPNWPIIKA